MSARYDANAEGPTPTPGSKASVASLLMAAKMPWRSTATERLALPERTVRGWRGSEDAEMRSYAAILGYCVCGVESRMASELRFGLDHERLAWLYMWDLAYGVREADAMACVLGETKRRTTAWLRRVEGDRSEAERAVWVRIGLTWLAGGVTAAPVAAYVGETTRGRIKTLGTRMREVTGGDETRKKRVAACAGKLVALCSEGGQHA